MISSVCRADVALVIEPDGGRASVPLGLATPHAVIVLGEVAHAGEAILLQAAFGLTHGEAVGAFRRGGSVGARGGHRLVVVPAGSRWSAAWRGLSDGHPSDQQNASRCCERKGLHG